MKRNDKRSDTMKSGLITSLTLFALIAWPVHAPADQDTSTRDASRHHVRPLDMHDVHIRAVPPSTHEERERPSRFQSFQSQTDDLPPLHSIRQNTFMTYQPPPAPDEQKKRNWILPAVQDGLQLREDQEPSGWGWLADEVLYRSEADEENERREDMEHEDEEFREAQFQSEEADTGSVGLLLAPLMRLEPAASTTTDERSDEPAEVTGMLNDPRLHSEQLVSQFAAMGADPMSAGAIPGNPMDGISGEPESQEDRWGMDRVWGISDEDLGVFSRYEPPMQSMIPSLSENLGQPDLAPPLREGIERAAAIESAPTDRAASDRDMDRNSLGTFTSSDPSGFDRAFGALTPGIADSSRDAWIDRPAGGFTGDRSIIRFDEDQPASRSPAPRSSDRFLEPSFQDW